MSTPSTPRAASDRTWHLIRRAFAIAAALFVGSCASVPQASPERDAAAKRFRSHPNAAAVYVYRPDSWVAGGESTTVLWVDNRLIGETLPRTFFRLDLPAGRHVMNVQAPDSGSLMLDIRAGEVYFVSLSMVGGSSRFERVAPEAGKRAILSCCALMENWAPGQRPLLR